MHQVQLEDSGINPFLATVDPYLDNGGNGNHDDKDDDNDDGKDDDNDDTSGDLRTATILNTPTSLLFWSDPHPITTLPRHIHRIPLYTPRWLVDALHRDPRSTSASADSDDKLEAVPGAGSARNEGKGNRDEPGGSEESDDTLDPARRIVLMRGLQRGMVKVLLKELGRVRHGEDSGGLDQGLDREFVDCFASRRPYRSPRKLQHRACVRQMMYSPRVRAEVSRYAMPGGFVWEYPEVVELVDEESAASDQGKGGSASRPLILPLSSKEVWETRHAVLFCRVGLWMTKQGSVLFLERELWNKPGQGYRKAKRQSTSTGAAFGVGETGVTESLEEVIVASLRQGWGYPVDQLAAVVAEAVYSQWLTFFDFLEPEPEPLGPEKVMCFRQIVRSLELNDEGEDDVPWKSLIDRIHRRLQLSPSTTPPTQNITVYQNPGATEQPDGDRPREPDDGDFNAAGINIPQSLRRNQNRQGPGGGRKPPDENQRALDRISYLGGILIPLPIISGILSMGEVYGPDGSKFYVFWAVGVPLAVITLIIIYADTIRKAEVWVEIGADHVVPTIAGTEDKNATMVAEERIQLTPQGRTAPSQRFTRMSPRTASAPAGPAGPGSVPYAGDIEVEERIIDMPTTQTETAPMSFTQPPLQQPPGDYDEDIDVDTVDLPSRRRRWAAQLSQAIPSMILERPGDGAKAKAWRREELGWVGAMQKILYKKFRDGADVPVGVEACERPGKRKTKSY
ncbi:uncharacterized protein C8A04DRAFT_12793 [Dichotomopilus funicola]|uniref:Uncharacterized protein n=1 Tax=Dichotomopilus funicola TaxID=1934379 RepID=A0AAN6V1G8_9PEZI|nr:hypothetical protein C8A04DRAFT_12793 [Dichotomopilus funicola]